eukprot:SAG22_NODE_1265_length_4958_cov_61.157440_1_plen_208_part_00
MCGGCGWNTGVYESWCADTLRGLGDSQQLAAALEKTNVAVLDLDMAGLNAAAAATLAGALQGNRSVTTINLGWNCIGDDGAAALAAALPGAAVRSIDLRANKIGPDGAAALLALVQASPQLHELRLSGNAGAGEEVLSAISAATAANQAAQLCPQCGEAGHGAKACPVVAGRRAQRQEKASSRLAGRRPAPLPPGAAALEPEPFAMD